MEIMPEKESFISIKNFDVSNRRHTDNHEEKIKFTSYDHYMQLEN
jgi:hypothetical protein